MGSQGDIYNILGIVTEAEEVIPHELFAINKRTVATGHYPESNNRADFEHGIISRKVDRVLKDPKAPLDIRILGYTSSMGSRHFEGKALVGYAIAAEYYWGSAKKLPANEVIDALRNKLVIELNSQLGLIVNPEDISIHLLYNSDQGEQPVSIKELNTAEELRAFRGF